MDTQILSYVFMAGQIVTVSSIFIVLANISVSKSKARQKKREGQGEQVETIESTRANHLENQIDSLRGDLTRARAEHANVKEELAKQRENSRIEKIELERLKKESSLFEESKKKEEIFKAQKQTPRLDIAELEELKKQNLELKDKLAEQEQVKAKLISVDQLKQELGRKDDRLKGLEEENKLMVSKIQVLENSLAEFNIKAQEPPRQKEAGQVASEELRYKNERLGVLESENKIMGSKLLEFEAKIVNLKKEIGDLTKQKNAQQIEPQEFQELKTKSLQLQDKISSWNEERKELIKRSTELEEELKKRNARLEAIEAESSDLRGKIKNADAVIITLKKTIEKTEGQKTSKAEKEAISEKDSKKKKIGQILLAKDLITQEILDKAEEFQKQHERSLIQYLLHYGYIDENTLAECLCIQFGIPYIPLNAYDISKEVIKLLPVDIVEKNWLIPVDQQGETIMVAMIDPLDEKAIKEVQDVTGLKVLPFVGIVSEIASALQAYYKVFIPQAKQDGRKALPFFIDTRTYKGVERRQAIRFEAEIDVQFPVKGAYQKSKTKDISRDGIAFISSKILPAGTILPIEINLPQEINPLPILATIQVVRFVELEDNQYEINAKILKISKQELTTVIEYAANYRQSSSS